MNIIQTKLFSIFFLIIIVCIELVLTNNFEGTIYFIFSLLVSLVITYTLKNSISDMFIAVYILKLFIFAWIIKVLNFESVTYGLLSENTTPLIVLFSVIIIFLLRLALSSSRNKCGIININFNQYNLNLTSKVFVFLGVAFQLLHIALKPVIVEGHDGGGFGGFGNFTSIGYLGIILYLYNLKIEGKKHIQFDYYIISVITVYLIISLLSNTKHQIITVFIAILLSSFSFGLKFKQKHVVLGVFFVLFISQIVTPVIQQTRSLNFRLASFSDKVELVTSAVFTSGDERYMKSFYRGYLPVESSLIDRLDILSETDRVVSGVDSIGFVGSYPITDGLTKALPGFLVPDRSQAATTDKIMWDIREKSYLLISRITIGLASSVYAVSGFSSFFVFFPIMFFLFIFTLAKLFGNSFENNVLGVFFLTKYLLFFTEKTFEGLMVTLLRDLPITLILVFMVLFFMKKACSEKKSL